MTEHPDDENTEQPPSVLPEHRRTTYTPPAEVNPERAVSALGVTDDDLAAAMAAELARSIPSLQRRAETQPELTEPALSEPTSPQPTSSEPAAHATADVPAAPYVPPPVTPSEPAPVNGGAYSREQLESLLNAPAPQTAPFADIPPPGADSPYVSPFADPDSAPEREPDTVWALDSEPLQEPVDIPVVPLIPPQAVPPQAGPPLTEDSPPTSDADVNAYTQPLPMPPFVPPAGQPVDPLNFEPPVGLTAEPPAVSPALAPPPHTVFDPYTQSYVPAPVEAAPVEPAPIEHVEPAPVDLAPVEHVEPAPLAPLPEPTAVAAGEHQSPPELVEPAAAQLEAPAEIDFNAILAGTGPLPDEIDDTRAIAETDTATAYFSPASVDDSPVTPEPQPDAAAAAPPMVPPHPSPLDTPVETDTALPAPRRLPAWRVEPTGDEPTPLEHRVGRSVRMFWLWFAANSSIVSIVLGATVLSLGMSIRQGVVAVLAGVAVSAIPLGLGALAGKWSGQPTMIVSRATFGHVGNILPALLALITRVFWAAVLVWVVSTSVAAAIDVPGIADGTLALIVAGVTTLIVAAIAVFGYGLLVSVHAVVSVLATLLVVGFVVLAWPALDLAAALQVDDGPWILLLGGAVLVFSLVGLVWAFSSSDLARYQRPESSGAATTVWASAGAGVPAVLLIGFGVVLAASDAQIADGLLSDPVTTLASLVPSWYSIPLVVGIIASLLAGAIVATYSAGFSVQALGLRMPRAASTGVSVVLVAAIAGALVLALVDFRALFVDLTITIAVPVAAWAGLFAAEMMVRNRRFDSRSLVHAGGTYPAVRWVNLVMLLVATGVGYGLTTASVAWLEWQGWLWNLVGVPLTSDLASTDVGVFAALLLGLLTPLIAGVPAIRAHERATAGELD